MQTITAGRSLDRRGKSITTYVLNDAAMELRSMDEGDVLELMTDDFEPFRSDVAVWCSLVGHKLLTSESIAEGHRFRIEKGTPVDRKTGLAMVISDPGLNELLSPLGFAWAAALEGMAVNLYFQGPAVRVLSKGFHPKLKGWARPFTRFAASGQAKTGHIAAQDKLRQILELGATIYLCGPSMEHFRVAREDLIFEDLKIVEYLTFMSIMERADVQLYV
ncbi:MAG: DsrE family protein [Actinomycetota bacterium]|nr:DsrE family protein [Actinomycetota bacterium]MDH5314038.1 DsrE family protein [Actinomycetota bacterium]